MIDRRVNPLPIFPLANEMATFLNILIPQVFASIELVLSHITIYASVALTFTLAPRAGLATECQHPVIG